MNKNDKNFIGSVFDDGGYVLNFSNASFDSFTLNSIGVPVQEKYQLSKAKSLKCFINEAADDQIIILITDLIQYAERYSLKIIYEPKFKMLKEMINNYKSSSFFSEKITDDVSVFFNDSYIENQLKIMLEMVERSPTDAIGKSKELVESCFKHILDSENIKYNNSDDLSTLRKKTFILLNLDSRTNIASKTNQNIKKLLSSFNQIIDSLVFLRNEQGDGHGKGIGYIELDKSEARLAINSSLTIIHYIWDIYKIFINEN